MTIDETFDRLRTLQDVLAEKIALETVLQEMPKTLEDKEALLDRLKKEYIAADQSYEDFREQKAVLRDQLLEAESRREKAEKNIAATNTQREYEIIDKERHDAAQKEQEFRKALQKIEKKFGDLDNEMKENKLLIDAQETELAEEKLKVERRQTEEGKKLAELGKREKELAEGLNPELLFKFERIIRNKGSRGIVAVKGGVCESCHMILPVQFANVVRLKEDIVSCPYCSSFLYYEDVDEGESNFLDEDLGALSNFEDDDEELLEDDGEIDDEEPVSADFEE